MAWRPGVGMGRSTEAWLEWQAGAAWALLKHGPDVKLDVGTSLEMEIQRAIPVDASRIQVARAAQ